LEAAKPHKERDTDDTDTDTDTESDDDVHKTKTVPNDIFDTLLSLVTPSERIQHDVKTRRQRQKTQQQQHPNKADKKRQNKTRRAARD
jgi:outer membrane receptor for ferrienterochelin and colicin